MPKMRGFKPEIWTDDKFVNLSPLARLLFMGIWNYACDNGHADKKPGQLKLRILPADNCDVVDLLDEIFTEGMAEDHGDYLTVPKLRVHQRIDSRYFTACDHCGPDETPEGTRRAHAGNTSGTRRAPALKEGSEGSEGESEGESTAGKPAKRATQLPQGFQPNEGNIQLAISEGIDLRREFAKFCDHHQAKGSTYKDWHKALNSWIRKAAEYGNVRPMQRPAQTGADGQLILPPLPMDDRR